MLHYNVAEADRNAAFRAGYTRLVIAQFGGGVNDEIREQIFGVPNPPPQVSGGQLSSVTPFTGNQGLDGLVYVEAIDRAMEQFGWTQVQTCLLYTSPSPRDS